MCIRDRECTERTNNAQTSMQEIVTPKGTNSVVAGSFARNELTKGSDVDWYLLRESIGIEVDEQEIRSAVSASVQQLDLVLPKSGGQFASVVDVPDMLESLGTKRDDRKSLSARILLLLEAKSMSNHKVLSNARSSILLRYLGQEYFVEGHNTALFDQRLGSILEADAHRSCAGSSRLRASIASN